MNADHIIEMFNSSTYHICFLCKKEMDLQQKLWYWGGMNDMLLHQECYLKKESYFAKGFDTNSK